MFGVRTRNRMSPLDHLAEWRADLKVATIFMTRLPVRHAGAIAERTLGRALRLAPLVGVIVGLAGALVFWLATSLGLPPLIAGLVTVGATMLLTGALHEDGLADVADGFGGGADPARKLEIMLDSRIGNYGVAALVLSIGLRGAALGALATAAAAGAALIAAHALSRALLPAVMAAIPPARSDGLAADAGRAAARHAATALILAALLAVALQGPVAALVSVLAAAATGSAVAVLARAQVGGYTGDVLGAVQQAVEATVLLAAAAML